MTTTTTANRRFAFHYVEMVIAMFIGMGVFAPVWHAVFAALGSNAMDRTDVMAMSMATDMVVGMSLWMWFRGHTAAPIVEMAVAMYLPFAVLLVPLWLGVIGAGFLMTGGHVLMLGTMLLAMLYRREDYSCKHHNRWSRRQRETATDPATAD
ncbi:MAG TPA: hypothetical protein VH969_33000 [Actinophytocola sp.]|jgi:hypothetical protein|uniref:hypothetical protein n=1 Tax=Actinophytocola sp. TaxID=1872138 RepID=UPI002F933E21